MKKNTLLIVIYLLMGPGCILAQSTRILVVLPDKFGLNTNLYREKFIEYGWEMEVTGVDSVISPCPWSLSLGAKPIAVDILIDSITDMTQYDAIVIAPSNWRINSSNAYGDLIDSDHFLELLVEANNEEIPIMTSCAGPLVLAAADILTGVNIQGSPGPGDLFLTQYLAAGANYLGSQLPPVTDGNIITTTRGQYYMKQNCDALLIAISNHQ